MDLTTFVEDIKQESARLEKDGMDTRTAYQEAIVTVFQRAAEKHSATAHEERLIELIRRIYGETRCLVTTERIAVEVGAEYHATYYHLRNLERKELIKRPAGPRSGWKAA